MELEIAAFRHLGDGADLVERIDSPKIGCLRQADRAGLAPVDLSRSDTRQCFSEAVSIDPAMVPANGDELYTAAEEPRGIGLGGIDVRGLAAVDDSP